MRPVLHEYRIIFWSKGCLWDGEWQPWRKQIYSTYRQMSIASIFQIGMRISELLHHPHWSFGCVVFVQALWVHVHIHVQQILFPCIILLLLIHKVILLLFLLWSLSITGSERDIKCSIYNWALQSFILYMLVSCVSVY